jgi:hypothetical protein
MLRMTSLAWKLSTDMLLCAILLLHLLLLGKLLCTGGSCTLDRPLVGCGRPQGCCLMHHVRFVGYQRGSVASLVPAAGALQHPRPLVAPAVESQLIRSVRMKAEQLTWRGEKDGHVCESLVVQHPSKPALLLCSHLSEAGKHCR